MSETKTDAFRLERNAEDGRTLVVRGDAYLASGAKTGVIICHGFKGFARWGMFPYLAQRLVGAGLNAVTFDLSGSGVGEDRENFTDPDAFGRNTFTQEQADLNAVLAEATRRGWVAEGVGMFGHSRGGGSAILFTARTPRVRALVTWAAVSHVIRWPAEDATKWRERGYTEIVNQRTGQVLRLNATLLDECERLGDTTLNIERAASEVSVPWLIVHGTADEAVPPSDAERLYAAAGGRGNQRATLELLTGVNHVFGVAHPMKSVAVELERSATRTVGFFATHLG